MSYRIVITRAAEEDIERLKRAGERASVRKLEEILAELAEHPESGVGSPEKLKYGMSGYWARRISQKHRIIYRIDNQVISVIVVSAYGHYTDR